MLCAPNFVKQIFERLSAASSFKNVACDVIKQQLTGFCILISKPAPFRRSLGLNQLSADLTKGIEHVASGPSQHICMLKPDALDLNMKEAFAGGGEEEEEEGGG